MSLFRSLGLMLLGLTAMGILAWSWVAWLPLVSTVIVDHGSTWGYVALGGAFLLTSAIAWGLWRVQDLLTRRGDSRGPTLPDQLYCQRCGHPATRRDTFCANCGDTRLGLRRRPRQEKPQ
jgi:hypothetical protein